MKNYFSLFIFIALFLISGCISSNSSKGTSDDQKIDQLKKEVEQNLKDNLLSWWSAKTVDYVNGGFYGRVNSKDSVIADADKGGILNARILWTYSAAYRITGDTSYLRLATRAKDYNLQYFIDKDYGGAYFSLTSKGEPKVATKQVYTNAFFIYSFAEYARATGDQQSLEAAKSIFELFEKYALDKESNGYFEVFSRDWNRVRLKMIGESSDKDEKTMNTSLHLMEAYANLYRVWPDPRMAERLRNMVELFLDRIIDKKTYHLINFMDRTWNRTSDVDSYGHDIECSWLLHEAASLLGDEKLLKRVEETSVKMAETVEEAIQPDGSIYYEKDLATGHINKTRSWWAQVETIVGYFNAWQISGNERFLDHSINCWNYTRDHMVDKVNGGWFPDVRDDGTVGRSDKAGHWICPYHNGRMCMEIMERVEKLHKMKAEKTGN
jgi:mannobiose 2-epimerase